MNYRARVYGLGLSANRPLPGLLVAPRGHPVDVRFDLLEGPFALVPEVAEVGWATRPVLDLAGGSYTIRSGPGPDGTWWWLHYGADRRPELEFVIRPDGCRVWAFHQLRRPLTDAGLVQSATTLLLGTGLGIVLRLRGTIALHGAAVALGPRAIVLLGNKGAGKSSLAAALARESHPILSDDVAAITLQGGSHVVHAGYPRLRLWPATLDALRTPAEGLAPVLPSLEKLYLQLASTGDDSKWRFRGDPTPIGAVYLLTRDDGLKIPVVEPVTGADVPRLLIANTVVPFLTLDRNRRAREFAALCRLAATVPLRRLRCPEGLEHLPALREALATDAETAMAGAA